MAIDPRISLMGIQPQFSLFDLGATLRTGQQLQAGRLAIGEEQRQQQTAAATREAFRQQYGGGAPPPGLAGLGPTVEAPGQAGAGEAPLPPLAEQEAAASQQALYGTSPPAQSPAPTVPSGSPQGLGGLTGQMGGGGQAPAGQQGQRAFVGKLYTIDPKAAMQYEQHLTTTTKAQYDAQKAQIDAKVARVEFLGRVADGVLESGNPQQAWEVGRAMLIEQGMPPSQVPVVFDPSFVRQLSGMARDAQDKYHLAQARLADAKAQSERGQAPRYTGNEAIDSILYSRYGDQIPPGQRPTPAMVQEARKEYLATDPQQRLYGQRARREEQEAEAFEDVQAAEPGAPGAAPSGGARGLPQSYLQMQPETRARVDAAVQAAARRHGVSEAELYGLMGAESDFAPEAKSKVGAIGLMQLMPATAKALGVDPYAIEGNIEGGAAYYAQMKRRYGGDVEKARAAYNAGPGAVDKYGGVPPYPETRQHGARTERLTQRFAGAPGGAKTAAPAPSPAPSPAITTPAAAAAPSPAPVPANGLVRRLAGGGGATPSPTPAADTTPPPPAPGQAQAATAPVPPRLQADEQRLERLEALRKRQEEHVERLRPLAGSEAGSKRLAQAERELSRRQSEIDTLRERLYEQGPESLERKKAVAQAGVEAALDKPLSSEDAALYGVPGGTTARELRDRVGKTPAPLSGEAAKTYQMGARMNRGNLAVAALEAAGVTGSPFLDTLEQTVGGLTGAIGTVVGVAAGGGFAGAGAGGAAGLGVGNLASPLVNQLRTPEQRRYVTAQLAFIAGILRKESGAAITAEEYRQYNKIYFPQSGDDVDTIAAKSAMRAEEIASLQEQFPNRTFPGAPAATTKVRSRAEREPGILTPRPGERPQPGQRGWPYQPGGALLD